MQLKERCASLNMLPVAQHKVHVHFQLHIPIWWLDPWIKELTVLAFLNEEEYLWEICNWSSSALESPIEVQIPWFIKWTCWDLHLLMMIILCITPSIIWYAWSQTDTQHYLATWRTQTLDTKTPAVNIKLLHRLPMISEPTIPAGMRM